MFGSPIRSIERMLPALMGVLLVVVATAYSWVGHREMERALLAGFSDRISGVSTLLSDELVGSVEGRQQTLATFASVPEVTGYLSDPDDTTRQAAAAHLRTGLESNQSVVALELWSNEGTCLLTASRPAPGGPISPAATEDCRGDPVLGLPEGGGGPLSVRGDSVYFSVSAPVRGTAGAARGAMGRIVDLRPLSDGPNVGTVLGLIGSDARILVGNMAGDAWSNLSVAVPGPPVEMATVGFHRYTDGDGVPRVGLANALPGTAWLLWVESPAGTVLAPLEGYVTRAGLASLMILSVGALIAWAMARRITSPLRGLTLAADAIAGGDATRRAERCCRSSSTTEKTSPDPR